MNTPIATYDLRNTIIPFSLLQISNFFNQMRPGQVIAIVGCDDGIAQDLKQILSGSKYEAFFAEKRSSHDGNVTIMLTRGAEDRKHF